jgi:hypothetical protein
VELSIFIFVSSLQYFSIPAQTSELLTDIITAAEASTLAICHCQNIGTMSKPDPPYFGSTIIP